jgi:hypothetical protein
VCIAAAVYLRLMLLNVVFASGLSSPRGYSNIDWITLVVIPLIAVVGAVYLFAARADRNVERHLHDTLEPTRAELPKAARLDVPVHLFA